MLSCLLYSCSKGQYKTAPDRDIGLVAHFTTKAGVDPMDPEALQVLDTLVSVWGMTEVLIALKAIAEDRQVRHKDDEKGDAYEKVMKGLRKLGITSGIHNL
jgi:hypothetical protein